MKTVILVSVLILFSGESFAQSLFKIVFKDDTPGVHYIADENDSILKRLDSTYLLAFQPETPGYFHTFAIQGEKGWCAIDIHGNIIFKVYNTETGTPSPDEISENMIRIIADEKIGFANEKGTIVIEPQFEIATSFKNGFAIVGMHCRNIPWSDHKKEEDHHYSTVCAQHGYIDLHGNIIESGDYTYEEISSKIGW